MVIIRVDDVSPNTDMVKLEEQVSLLLEHSERVILGVNIFSKWTDIGSVYPDAPFKNKPQGYFFDVNKIISLSGIDFFRRTPGVEIAAHGLVHARHDELSEDACAMSVLTSCKLLQTNTFIPPFNMIGQALQSVCDKNGIFIMRNDERITWRSLETEKLDPSHPYWYYHPWRMSLQQLKEALG